MKDFNELDYQGLDHPVCPKCNAEVLDVHNGGDPAAWWNSENIPDADLKHTCTNCNQVFRINVSWSPNFKVVPVELDDNFDCDYGLLDEA